MRPAPIWTVLNPVGRMVHYSTDRDEADTIVRLQGGSVEQVSAHHWYSPAAFPDELGAPHPADVHIALEFAAWQRHIDRAGGELPPLEITGPPILEGQLVE